MENELVPVECTGPIGPILDRRSGDLIAAWEDTDRAVVCSMDTATEQGKADYFACKSQATRLAKQSVAQELPVRDWLIHEIELTNVATGEVTPALRLVLVLADGTTVSTTSRSLIDGWRDVVRWFGLKTLNPPLIVKIKAIKAREVGEYLVLESISRRPDAAVRKAK